MKSSSKTKSPRVFPPPPGRLGRLLLPFVLVLGAGVEAQIVTLMDVRDLAAAPGAASQSVGIVLSNANGLSSFEFDLSIDPPGILQNLRTDRGAHTTGFETWQDEIAQDSIHVAASTTQNPVSMPMGRNSEIARLVFDVAASTIAGETVSLVIARASSSLPFDLLTDLGTLVVGTGPAPVTQRNLNVEVVPKEVFPGDTVLFSVYVNDVPELTTAQIFLDYPEGALFPEGEVGGELVESLGWSGSYVQPKQIGDRPFILVDRLFGNAEPPGLGRIQVATLSFRIGSNWGGEWRGFGVEVDDLILFGDLLAGDENLYHAQREGAALEQEPPDLNGDGVLDSEDVFEFGDRWRKGEGSR